MSHQTELEQLRAFRNQMLERNPAAMVPGTNGDMIDLGWTLQEHLRTAKDTIDKAWEVELQNRLAEMNRLVERAKMLELGAESQAEHFLAQKLAMEDELKQLRANEKMVGLMLQIDAELPQFIVTHVRLLQDEKEAAEARVKELSAVIEQTHTNHCTAAWTDRGLHSPECLLFELL
jgi:hypothetical protein